MHKLFLYIWLFVIAGCCTGLKSNAQTLNFKNYSVNHGLASSTVYAILQDSKGFIWFATEGGVNRFDGKTFELFTIDNGLSDNEVLQIEEDSKGRIWFLTLNGKLSYYFNKRIYNPINNELLKRTVCKGSFVSFYEDSNKNLWFSTNQNRILNISNSGEVKFLSSAHYPLIDAFIFENPEKQIAVFTRQNLLVLQGGVFVNKKTTELPISTKAIYRNKASNSLFFISETGLIHYKNSYNHIFSFLPENVVASAATTFVVDKKSNVWLGTMGHGLFQLNSISQEAKSHLKENLITDLLQDQQGNIWVSTIGNGVYMVPAYAQATLNYTNKDGLNSKAIHSILKIRNKLVLGLRNGNIDLIEKDRISHQYLNEKTYNPVTQLYYDKERESVWFASNNQLGELNLNNGSYNFVKEKGGGAYAVKDFSVSKNGKIALALASGVYLVPDKNKLIFDSKHTLLNSPYFKNRAFSVYYDSSERLWFANLNGLFCHYNTISLFQSKDAVSQRITDIAELPDKSILCSTYGYGVFVLKDFRRVKTISTKNGLLSNICKKIYIKDNAAWLVTAKGISIVDFDNHAKVTNYGTESGLTTSEVNDLIVENDSLYAATNNGLSIFKTTQHLIEQDPPKLYFNQLTANKKPIATDTIINLPYQKNNITANFIALDFEHPASVKYSYKLNPELKWNETSNNFIEFASLQPGTYHLQIRAKSVNSNWSSPIEITFTINSPFWKTWWFLVLSITGIAVYLFYLINKYYRNRRAKENERLLTRTKIISLEQQALQAMMNPHFVFNVMNSIQYFINTKDNAMANQALTGFARLLRKNLENCTKSYITIEEEVSYLNLYLSLEKMRFGERMNYTIEVDKGINKEETYIPSMLLQPFVENAIWHGLMPKEDNGTIFIGIRLKDPAVLEIEITDDGVGIDNSLQQKTEGHISRGMQLTRDRIKLLNTFKDKPIQIKVQQLHPEGTQVLINIPFIPFTH